jgi:5'(3')-deoxyribonucleotidase
MKIGIDLDGVTANWTVAAREMLNERWGHNFDLTREVPHWDYLKTMVTKKQWAWLWTAGVERGLFLRPHVFPGAQAALEYLCDNHDVFFLTDRPKKARAHTIHWISSKLDVNAAGLMIDKTKTLIPCDVFLDDKPENVQLIKFEYPKAQVFLMNRLYNEAFTWEPRVSGWDEFMEKVDDGD